MSAFNPVEESNNEPLIVKKDPVTGKWNATIVLKDESIDGNCIVEEKQNENNQSDDSDSDSFCGSDSEEEPEKPKKTITRSNGTLIYLLDEDEWTCIGCQYKEFSVVGVERKDGNLYEEPKYIVDRSKGLCYCSGGCMYVKAGPFVYAEKDPLFEGLYGPNGKLKGHPNIVKF